MEEMKSKSQRNVFLDLVKLLCSYLVVFIHAPFPGRFGMAVNAIARVAVPVFFMVSGYFSYKTEWKVIKKKVLHILKIYLSACIFYWIFKCILLHDVTDIISYTKGLFSCTSIVLMIIFNNSQLGPTWFLLALIYCYLIQYLLIEKLRWKKKSVYIISAFLLIIHLFVGEIFRFSGIKIPILFIRNAYFMGFPFFMMGHFFKSKEERITQIADKTIVVVFILGSLLAVTSNYYLKTNLELYFGSVLMASSVFIMTQKKKDILLLDSSTAVFLGDSSLYVYILHSFVITLIMLAERVFAIADIIILESIRPITVCVVTTLISLIYIKFKESIKKLKV